MSSLAGALDPYSTTHNPSRRPSHADSDMHATPSPRKNTDQNDEDEDDDDQVAGEDEEMSDLFGEDDNVEHQKRQGRETASPSASGPESERLPSAERDHRQALEYEEEDAPQEIIEEQVKEAEVSLPNLPVPKPSDGNSWVVRIPTFMAVDSKPFHPDTYIGPEQEEEDQHGTTLSERSMSIKLKVGNALRWRWTKDEFGQDRRQSNARIVRWSDGSLSLRIGKELFDIDQAVDNSGSVHRQTLGAGSGSQSQSQSQNVPLSQSLSQQLDASAAANNLTPGGPSKKTQGLTYLVAQHKRSQVLQAEAVITGHMSIRPTGMQSETHKMLVRAVGQKHSKVARMKITDEPTVDPEREKAELMKQSNRKSSRKKHEDEFGMGLGGGSGGHGGGHGGGRRKGRGRHDVMWSDDEDEGMGGMYGDEYDDDDDGHRSQSSSPKKAKKSKGEGEDYQADDFVVPDSDEDGEGGGSSSKRKRHRGSDAEDDLERMEANLEKQAAAQRRQKGGQGGGKGGKRKQEDEDTDEDVEMEVESEEEDDFKVRRVTGKRAIAADDDEDDE